jgi:hypothetical protein
MNLKVNMALSGKLRLNRVTIIISCMVFIVPHKICREDENRMFSNRFPNNIVLIEL